MTQDSFVLKSHFNYIKMCHILIQECCTLVLLCQLDKSTSTDRAHLDSAEPLSIPVHLDEVHILHDESTAKRDGRRVVGQAEVEHAHPRVEILLGQVEHKHVVGAPK